MLAAAALLSSSTAAGAPVPAALEQLCRQAGVLAGCAPLPRQGAGRKPPGATETASAPPCPADWPRTRRGGCWAKAPMFDGRGEVAAYVHRRGWVVDPRCFADTRFTGAEMLASLEAAWRKMDPGVAAGRGGCLGEFNPQWGRELTEAVWERRMHVSCPAFDPKETTCAHHESRDDYERGPDGFMRRVPGAIHLLVMRNAGRCMGSGSPGLPGILFHETLHAAGADNFPVEEHNNAWELEQWVFVKDRVYGAEAVCFFGVEPSLRPLVNVFQCRNTVSYRSSAPRLDLCREFGANFTNLRPLGFLKH